MKGIKIQVFFLFAFVKSMVGQTTLQNEVSIATGTEVSIVDHLTIASNGILRNDGELILKGNLINNGILSYTTGSLSGTFSFEGDMQKVSGTQTAIFYNVLFNNTETALLGNILIDGVTDFTKGIINTRDYQGSIIFNETATHNNASNTSFVNGAALKRGAQNFTFPVGDKNAYRSVTIENLDGVNLFSGTYFLANSHEQYPHDQKDDIIKFIDTKEYWKIEQVQGNDAAIITLSRDPNTSSPEIVNTAIADLRIVRWDASENYWVNEGAVVKATNDNSIKTVTKVSGYGIYALATVFRDKIYPDDVVVYNNLTPNGDGVNDALLIEGIEKHPNNVVRIFNRWGRAVFEIKGYNNKDKVFKGYANTSLTLDKSSVLPAGTYYYILTYTVAGKLIRKIDYLYINGK